MHLNDELFDDDLFSNNGPNASEQGQPANPPNPAESLAPQENLLNGTENAPTNSNRRRSRSNSDNEDEEEARLARRAFMEQEMDAHNIRGSDRALGRHFADLDPQKQVLSLFAFQLAQRAQIDNFAAADFLRSDIYETHVVGRIKTALLAPYLSNYVTLLQEWILSNMLSAKDAWRMEDKVTDVAEQWHQFSSELKSKMTQLRSQNKTIMYRMRDKGADVNEITIKLAPKGMVIKEYHRARVAWILLATVEFDELCEQREQKPQQFWDWIGSQLVALKTRIATDPQYTTEAARRHKLNSVFSRALTMHCDQFPPKGPAAPPKPRPAWQETLEVAMDLGAVV